MDLGSILAGRLAAVADQIADTFERLAVMHEGVARTTGSEKAAEARSRAAVERSVEEQEREAAQWFRAIEASALLRQEPRLPSQ